MNPKWKGILSVMLLITAIRTVFISSEYHQPQDVKNISPKKIVRIQTLPATTKRTDSLKIAVSAMLSPKETIVFYKEILASLSQKTSLSIQLVQRETYEEINTLLKRNELDVAFVCTGSYVKEHNDFGMELLVAPVVHDKPVYYSYIIVPQESPAHTLSDLRGKTFAFTDPMSNTGKLSPTSNHFSQHA